MGVEIVVTVVVALLGFGEFYVWYSEILWHKAEDGGDRRNWTPRR
jgi:hypothetical protein